MTCGDIMRRPVEVGHEQDSIQAAARRMRDRNVGFLPVVAESGRVVGVVTDRDLALRACARGLLPDRTRVTEIMSLEPVSCRPEDDLEWAGRLMALHQVSRVVVVDVDDRPIGVISLSDLAVHLDDAAATLRRVAIREVVDAGGHRVAP